MDGRVANLRRRMLVAGGAATLAGTAALSQAWACTATTFLTLSPTQTAPAGSRLTAQVYAAGLVTGPADLRLLEGGRLTTTLASADAVANRDFSLPFTVPDLAPGVHYLALENGGRVAARASFAVVVPDGGSAAGAGVADDTGRSHGSGGPGGASPAAGGWALAGVGAAALATFGLVTGRRRRLARITR